MRLRDLRSSFATLLIYEGQPPQYVAEQLGHSAATLLRDYARVWEDFDPSQRVSIQIERARVRPRRDGDEHAEGELRRRVRTSRRGNRVPQVFRDHSAGSHSQNDETAD